ncbi:hypothetical protein FQR65_LT02211 [Abscondita terminalis]|nr:hypothetical protein FQR65_LT02211 [Abscondita terminalis]
MQQQHAAVKSRLAVGVFILVRSTTRLHHLVVALQLHFGYKPSNMGDFDTEKFIILIQEKQCIRNLSSEEYKNRDKKIDAWKEILEELHPDSNLWTPEERKIKGKTIYSYGQEEAEEFLQSLQGALNIQRPTAATCRSKNNFEKKLLDILESRQPPIAHYDENDDDLNFFKSLLPTLKTLDEQQKMEF